MPNIAKIMIIIGIGVLGEIGILIDYIKEKKK